MSRGRAGGGLIPRRMDLRSVLTFRVVRYRRLEDGPSTIVASDIGESSRTPLLRTRARPRSALRGCRRRLPKRVSATRVSGRSAVCRVPDTCGARRRQQSARAHGSLEPHKTLRRVECSTRSSCSKPSRRYRPSARRFTSKHSTCDVRSAMPCACRLAGRVRRSLRRGRRRSNEPGEPWSASRARTGHVHRSTSGVVGWVVRSRRRPSAPPARGSPGPAWRTRVLHRT